MATQEHPSCIVSIEKPENGVIANSLFAPHSRSNFAFVTEAVATHLENGGRSFATTLFDEQRHFTLMEGVAPSQETAIRVAKTLTEGNPLQIHLVFSNT